MRDVQLWHRGNNQLAIFVAPCLGIRHGDWMRHVHESVVTGSLFEVTSVTCPGLILYSLIKEQAARKT